MESDILPIEAEDMLVPTVPLLIRALTGLRRGEIEPPRLSKDFLLSGGCEGPPDILIDILGRLAISSDTILGIEI